MGDLVNYRVLLCVAVAVFVVLMTIYVLHSTRRFPPPLRDHVKPAKKTRRPICSFDVFRDIARGRRDGFVSGNGTWTRNGRGAPEHFEPEICRFRHDVNIPTPEVLQCIRRHRLRYVVFAGDSNSMQYFAAFQGLLTRVGGRCVAIQVRVLFIRNNEWTLYMSCHATSPSSLRDAWLCGRVMPGFQHYIAVHP